MNFFKQLLYITAGLFILSAAVNFFLAPHGIAAGGVTGISMLIEKSLGVPISTSTLIINSVLLVVGLIFLGVPFFLKTAIGSTLFPIILALIPRIMLTEDKFLSAVFASVLIAIAVTLMYKSGSSSGGTTIPPLVLKKYTGISTSIGLLLTDAIVVISSIFIFGIESFLYAVIVLVLTSIVMSYLETGLKKRKSVFIISEHHEEITNNILDIISRGTTIIPTIGAYTKDEKNMLMVVVDSSQYHTLIELIDRIDNQAFVTAHEVSDVHGLGFSYESVIR